MTTETQITPEVAPIRGVNPAPSGFQPVDLDENIVPVGVWGDSSTGVGVFATAGRGETAPGTGDIFFEVLPPAAGLVAFGSDRGAVDARSRRGFGVDAQSQSAAGVRTFSVESAGLLSVSGRDSGVDAVSAASLEENPDAAAVRGQSTRRGLAGLFVGQVRVTGQLGTAGGGFTIDHPLAPDKKYLSHAFVHSPEMLNVYSGTVTTDDDGCARVELPPYFEALNRDVRYQLTVIGEFARAIVSEEIKGNEFAIRTDVPGVKVCWQVSGVRRDAWAEANPIPVEEEKPDAVRGRYLHPELFDSTAGIHRGLTAARLRELLPRGLRDDAERLLS